MKEIIKIIKLKLKAHEAEFKRVSTLKGKRKDYDLNYLLGSIHAYKTVLKIIS